MKFCMYDTPLLYVQSPAYSNIIMADARNLLGWEQFFFPHLISMKERVK